MSKLIYLTNEKTTLVDDEDYDKLAGYSWREHRGYAVRMNHDRKVDNEKMTMHTYKIHREVLNLKVGDGKIVDHINGNKLDNRKCNLRLVNARQSSANTPKKSANTSGYKGVSYIKKTGLWKVSMYIDGKAKHIGHYEDKEIAAIAHDIAAVGEYGEYARLNYEW
jgi:hypothetical protein